MSLIKLLMGKDAKTPPIKQTKTRFYFTNQTADMDNAREMELKIEEATGLELENPFFDGDQRELKQLKSTGKTNLSADEIVAMDEKKIREREGIIAFMSHDKNIGSSMEIVLAAKMGKAVYTIATLEHIRKHPWIIHFSNKVFKNVYEFIKYAQENQL